MNKRGKSVDKTFLSVDQAEERGFLHRDYIAHCLRWSHVVKRLCKGKAYATARLLDIGCGRELPLAKTLYSSRYIVEHYFGVDVGPILESAEAVFAGHKFPLQVWEHTDILSITLEDLGDKLVNWATMFEVAEHVEPQHLYKMLTHIRSLCTPDATFMCSTPCWNRVDCADNHVNEMTYEAFGSMLEQCGWSIQEHYGTFASIRDYEQLLSDFLAPGYAHSVNLLPLFEKLRSYYDTNLLSCIFAPLFPAQSRNVLWVCRPSAKIHPLKFPKLKDCQEPWGSSTKWQEMVQPNINSSES